MIKKSHSLFLALVLCSFASKASVSDALGGANNAMATLMQKTVEGSGSVLSCAVIGRGVKNSFTTLRAIDDAKAEPYINYGCGALYASFIAAAYLGLIPTGAVVPK